MKTYTKNPGEIICQQFATNHFEFEDGFECAIDSDGIIWIKHNYDNYFSRPCMRYCYTEIKMRDENIAKSILEQSCEIQNDEIITERAKNY